MSTALATNSIPGAASPAPDALRDIKPPVVIPSGWWWVIWLFAIVAVLFLLFLAWHIWKRRRLRVPPIIVIPPHIRARQRLEEALALIGQPREFCTAVSDAARVYLEERFDFHAPERTTEEFLYELKGTHLLTRDQKESLGEFLNRCDLVKFAKYEPREPELRDLHASALRLVEETEPVPAPAPGTAADSAAQPARVPEPSSAVE
jgi:hypothetical protein